ncbi:SigE family RNA polymerase sigma factor [Streptomyces gardneri]|uniref:RNA polymerase sigma24 factor n=1 Tax=Streptomyces gardneri TaxID=66892 RepID=A0A4Y3RT01_9ACTN|nr:SigE family RNA polymerase sigma factor [Streptomyces gardneri]GEB61041.1 RNA polymerase sigma24 factor [Streptomyces gardneri]GHH14368.1 RNA polymerase sigma24 factor [Streptomyces gardneri]
MAVSTDVRATEPDIGVDVGSDAGFEEFARAAQQRLYRTAYLLCGDAETARDLTQTTLAKLYQHWRRAGAADHPYAYAKTVLTRTFLSERRRGLRDLLVLTRTGGTAPAPAADHADLRVTLLAALAELPPRARAMVVLRYWEDQSVASVATLLRCSEATVKSQCSRSLARLRVRLADAGLSLTES